MKTCSRCRTKKPADEFYPDKSKKDGRHTACKECVKADRRARYSENPEKYLARGRAYQASERGRVSKIRRYEALRKAALEAYGGSCACCGESEPDFLTVDHVGGWGAAHRKELGAGAGNILQWLKKAGYPQDGTIQLLCWNCNCAIGVRGSCPHRREE